MQLQHPFRLVTPTVDGAVLSVLAGAEATFTATKLASMLPHSVQGIRKVLRRLSEQGIVETEQVGPVVSYRLNRHHLGAAAVIEIATLRRTFFARVETEIAAWVPPPIYAAVFGSAARGEMSASSDVDILIVRPEMEDVGEDPWTDQVDEFCRLVAGWTGNAAEVVEYEQAQVTAGEPMLIDVLEQGVTVFGSRSWLRQRLRPRSAS